MEDDGLWFIKKICTFWFEAADVVDYSYELKFDNKITDQIKFFLKIKRGSHLSG